MIDFYKKAYTIALHSRELNVGKKTIDLNFVKAVVEEARKSEPSISQQLLDALSYTQFESKFKLIGYLYNTNILTKDTNITVLGCWFNIILASLLHKDVKVITGYDMDDSVIRVAKRLFKNYDNVNFFTMDVFKNFKDIMSKSNLIINTSCEHMAPMNSWPWWDKIKENTYVALQSHNIKNINGHINCVDSLKEFKNQMPKQLKIIYSDTLNEKERDGKRFTIIGIKNE